RAGAPTAGLFLHDPFAGEVTQALERFALSRSGLAYGADGREPTGTGLVVVGERDGREVAVDVASASLALLGPGAADAARALLATFLAGTEPASGEAVVVGGLVPAGPGFPGLRRLDDGSGAVDDLEAELARREAYRTEEGGPPLPDLLLVTPPPADSGPLSGVLQRARALGVGVVIVGGEADGATAVSVSARGTVRAVSPPEGAPSLAGSRLFVLGEGAAGELLGVLAAARTDDERVPTLPVEDEPFAVLATPEAAPISVRVLGDYRIEAGGREIRSGLRAKARELLAFYLLHPEGTTLDLATEALWPEADPGRGSEWFWTALGNLRSLLRRSTGTKTLKVIERDGDRYRIEPVFDVDLWRFQEALPPAGVSTGDAEWASRLQTAADAYGGELLADVDWAWAEVPREDLRRRAVDVLVSLAATRLVAGDARAALDALSRAVEIDPVAEQLYRRIMRLHARQARVDEVEATYLRLKARLAELDLEPTPESQQLLAELSRTGDGASSSAPSDDAPPQ
ncbi:MAG TPA: BTAD domain-containing putative transcriptional regulator, partial [Acidimicrobiales bacterium]|nr:BTAD domain-containing putative transcriptional regulator [Acidimicrobiales bacterium]